MTEPRPEGLPERPVAPVFTPPAGGAALASGRARRRRRAQVGLASSSMLLVAALIVIPAGGGAPRPTSTLVTTDDPSVPTTATPSDDTTPAPPAPSDGTPSDPATGGGASGGSTGDGSSPAPDQSDPAQDPPPNDDPDAPQSPWPTPTITAAPSDPNDVARPMTRSTHPARSMECVNANANGWCLSYTGATDTAYAHEATFSAELCRLPGAGAGTLHFSSGLEMDLQLDDGAGDSWEWSTSASPDGGAHAITVPASTCEVWTTVWPARDDDGLLMPQGDYNLLSIPAATDLDVPGTTRTTQTTSFQVD